MKKTLFFIFLFSICFKVYAADSYVIEKPDGSVAILHYFGGSKSLNETLNEQELEGLPIYRIDPNTLPDKKDRKYWRFNHAEKKVEIDEVKKLKDEADKVNGKKRKKALIQKTGLSEDEYKELKEIDRKYPE